MSKAQKLITPIGELKWVFIDGEGKEDLNGNPRYVASLCLETSSDAEVKLKGVIDGYWDENKPKGRKCKSKGYYAETANKTDDNPEGEETGNTVFQFWTGTKFPDGKPKLVKVYNAKGNEASLGGKRIGNGSIGAISGAMGIYDNGPAATGVTLYLNAVQIKKLEEFSDDAGFGAVDDGDGWSGESSDFEGTAEDESIKASEEAPAKKVRL